MPDVYQDYSTATSGTITLKDTKQDTVFVHNAASLSNSLTVTFPANPRDGQRMTISSAMGVTTLTLSSSKTILGSISSIAAGAGHNWYYCAQANKWFKV